MEGREGVRLTRAGIPYGGLGRSPNLRSGVAGGEGVLGGAKGRDRELSARPSCFSWTCLFGRDMERALPETLETPERRS